MNVKCPGCQKIFQAEPINAQIKASRDPNPQQPPPRPQIVATCPHCGVSVKVRL